MLELPVESFDKVRQLVRASDLRGHLALVYEVLEGRRTGKIFVDNLTDPQTALLCGASGFFFAFGEPDESLVDQLIQRYWRPGRDDNYTTLFGSSPAWNATLQRSFEPYHALRESRLAFELMSMPEIPGIPKSFALWPITANLARSILDGSGTGGYGIDPWFVRIAGGPVAYTALGLGLALVHEDAAGCIASICGVCGLGGGEVELEVGTIPAFRGRGLAVIVSTAFMHQCREKGLSPTYSCGSDNSPSIAVAHKLGYVEIEEIHGYRLYDECTGPGHGTT